MLALMPDVQPVLPTSLKVHVGFAETRKHEACVHTHVCGLSGDKLEALVAEEAAQQAATAAEVAQLRAQLSQAEAATAAAEQQAGGLAAQLVEAQQALIDADRQVGGDMHSMLAYACLACVQPHLCWPAVVVRWRYLCEV